MFRLIIVILVVSSCSTTQIASTKYVKQMMKRETKNLVPIWVYEKPINKFNYTGIGSASFSSPNFMTQAKLEALKNLSSEINQTLQFNSLLSRIENREEFLKSLLVTTIFDIDVYEHAHSWSDGTQYWTYYQLDKKKFHRILAWQKVGKLEQATVSFINATKAESEVEFSTAIRLYAQTIEELKHYLNEENKATIEGKPILLANESYQRIQRLLREVQRSNESKNIVDMVAQEIEIEYPVTHSLIKSLIVPYPKLNVDAELPSSIIQSQEGVVLKE